MELSKVYCPLSKSSSEVYIPHEYKDKYSLKIIEILRSNIELFTIKTILKVYMIIQSHDVDALSVMAQSPVNIRYYSTYLIKK